MTTTSTFYGQPRFWTTCFEDESDDLMHRLANNYDANDTFRAIAMCGGSTFYCEPMVRQTASAQNMQNLRDARYTDAEDRTRLGEMIDDHAARWATTPTFMAFNPYQRVEFQNVQEVAKVDEMSTEAKMDDCRSSIGRQPVHPAEQLDP